MVEFDDVLLLRPAWEDSGVRIQQPRPPATATRSAPGFVDITIFPLREAPSPALLAAVRAAEAVLREGGALDVAWYVTEHAPNNFPRLPVRADVQVLVGVALFASRDVFDAFARGGRWQEAAAPGFAPHLGSAPQALRLLPTARSALRG